MALKASGILKYLNLFCRTWRHCNNRRLEIFYFEMLSFVVSMAH